MEPSFEKYHGVVVGGLDLCHVVLFIQEVYKEMDMRKDNTKAMTSGSPWAVGPLLPSQSTCSMMLQ